MSHRISSFRYCFDTGQRPTVEPEVKRTILPSWAPPPPQASQRLVSSQPFPDGMIAAFPSLDGSTIISQDGP